MKKLIYLFAMVMLMSGCATTITPLAIEKVPEGECIYDDNIYVQTYVCNNYQVEFISNPPGAKIEINNDYIGDTPIVWRVHGNYKYGYWIVKAYPIYEGQFVQTKKLNMPGLPHRVYFDLNLGPATPSVDVNVNK